MSCVRVSQDIPTIRQEKGLGANREASPPPPRSFSKRKDDYFLAHFDFFAEPSGRRISSVPPSFPSRLQTPLASSPPSWDRPLGDQRIMRRWVAACFLLCFSLGTPPLARGEGTRSACAGDPREQAAESWVAAAGRGGGTLSVKGSTVAGGISRSYFLK